MKYLEKNLHVQGRFPFDQIFRFEIPGIPCDEWNSIFFPVGWSNPSQVIMFQVSPKIRNKQKKTNGGLLPILPSFALEFLDDSEVETNDVSGEDDTA